MVLSQFDHALRRPATVVNGSLGARGGLSWADTKRKGGRIIGETTPFFDSPSWQENGAYSTPHPTKRLRAALKAYRIGSDGPVDAPDPSSVT